MVKRVEYPTGKAEKVRIVEYPDAVPEFGRSAGRKTGPTSELNRVVRDAGLELAGKALARTLSVPITLREGEAAKVSAVEQAARVAATVVTVEAINWPETPAHEAITALYPDCLKSGREIRSDGDSRAMQRHELIKMWAVLAAAGGVALQSDMLPPEVPTIDIVVALPTMPVGQPVAVAA